MEKPSAKNIVPQEYHITQEHRSKLKNHRPMLIWFVGLSGSGKSTLANLLEQKLYDEKIHTFTLDGDNIRSGLNKDLSFSEEDRSENIRRIAEVAKLFIHAGNVVLAAFITPLEKDREGVKKIIGSENYVEIFVDTSLEECERRDVKGLYKKARAGEIENFTGITGPFEKPKNADVVVDTEKLTEAEAVEKIMQVLRERLK